jgi:hypothetical protein
MVGAAKLCADHKQSAISPGGWPAAAKSPLSYSLSSPQSFCPIENWAQ